MKTKKNAYIVFDDFPESALGLLEKNHIRATIQKKGKPRPNSEEMKNIIDNYDIVIIGTGQKLTKEIFKDVKNQKIIGTASIGMDHIDIPENKTDYIKVVNAPKANRSTVVEYIFAIILSFIKEIYDGRDVAFQGYSKKNMAYTPRDLSSMTIGVIGAGGIGSMLMETITMLGIRCLCWTRNPLKHSNISGVVFVELDDLLKESDIISLTIPFINETRNFINKEKINLMKNDAIFVSISRTEVIDLEALFHKAEINDHFRIGMDVDSQKLKGLWKKDMNNVIVTPHIAGGTVESRRRLFEEVTYNVINETGNQQKGGLER